MRRREFLTLLGSTVAAYPLAAQAQPTIGFLHLATSDAIVDRLRAFQRGLKETGFIEGDNVAIAYRFAEGRVDRLPDLAADLVRQRVNVIVSPASNEVASAAIAATRTIPILFVVAEDPVKLGYVTSLARPSGNATGVNFFNAELSARRLDLLRQVIPTAKRVALLVNPNTAASAAMVRDLEAAAPTMGLQIQVVNARTSSEIDAAFARFERERPDALYVGGSSVFNSRRLQLSLMAMRYMLPASYSSRDYPEYGGLMSYGTDVGEAFRQIGVYAGRILKGAKPADLPVIQSTKFEFVINLIAARALGLSVPPDLLSIADEVIE